MISHLISSLSDIIFSQSTNFAQFWTNLTHFLPFLDDDGPVLRVFDPILSENTQKQGVKSENKFCLIKYPSHIMAPTLVVVSNKIDLMFSADLK